MEKIVINGGNPLYGEIEVSGMKNAAVAVIMGSLLNEEKCVIENVPDISDVSQCFEIFNHMGSVIRRINKTTYEIDNSKTVGGVAPFELVRKMRASTYLLGAELGRYGKALVSYPGGCNFAARPIDYHIKGLEALGATVTNEIGGFYKAVAPSGLRGSQIYLDFPSVGATINIILAAVRAYGNTVLENAAREPHVVDLANFLNACGANISGAGTDVIKIKGVKRLHGCTYAILPDMIEAGTYMACTAAAGGCVTIKNIVPKHLDAVASKLEEMGVDLQMLDDSVVVTRKNPLGRVNVKALPYPGVPTDMNPQFCVLMCLAHGTSILTEGVFDTRFTHVEELRRMGAEIKVELKSAIIEGKGYLNGAIVKAADLRAGAAMIMAGLAANGETVVEDIYHIERGYENIVEKLRNAGADIKKINYPDPAPAYYQKAN